MMRMDIKVISSSEEKTHQISAILADQSQAGDVYLLEGELGAGKTTFAKGFAKELGIDRVIKSPTYTIIREYTEGKLPFYHMDLYRLDEEEAEELGLQEYFEGYGVTMVEWASMASDELPDEYIKIELQRTGNHEEERELVLRPVGDKYVERLETLRVNLIMGE